MELLIIVPITTGATLFVECLGVCGDQNLEHSTNIWFAKCPSQQNTTVDNRPLFRESNAHERMICRVPNSQQNKVLSKALSVANDSWWPLTMSSALGRHSTRACFAKCHLQTLEREGFWRVSSTNTWKGWPLIFRLLFLTLDNVYLFFLPPTFLTMLL